MKLTEKCVILPYERYQILLQSNNNQSSQSTSSENSTDKHIKEEKIANEKDENIKEENIENEKDEIQEGSGERTDITQSPNSQTLTSEDTSQLNHQPESSYNNVSAPPALPPPGIPKRSRKRKLSGEKPKKIRKTWKDLWTEH